MDGLWLHVFPAPPAVPEPAAPKALPSSVMSLKARIIELEMERNESAQQRSRQHDELTSMRVQVSL